MLKGYLRKTKMSFVLFMGLWMVLVVAITQERVLEKQVARIERESQYLSYKFEYDQGKSLGLASIGAAIAGAFKGPQSANSASVAEANGTAMGVPVLLYHGINDHPDRFSMTPDTFKDQLFSLKRAGWQAIRLDDFIQYIKGNKALPPKSVLIVFDDGRVDSYEGADPVLRTLGWSAVMFVATGQSFPASGIQEYYLDKQQIQQMVASGRWEIQSHAIQEQGGQIYIDAEKDTGNLLSNKMWLANENRLETDDEYRQRIENEFAASKQTIVNATGIPVRAFAYPYGDFGLESQNAQGIAVQTIHDAVSKNYEVAFQQTWDLDNFFTYNYVGNEPDFYRLRRVEPETDWTGAKLVDFLSKSAPKPLPYTDWFTENNGWKIPWGDLSFDSRGMHLDTSTTTDGAFTFLDGSRDWTNYMFMAKIQRQKGGYVTLFARYQNDDNYVSCTFSDKTVKVDEKVDGNSQTLIEDKNPITVPLAEAYYGVYVSGSEVKCYEGGAVAVVSFSFDQKLSSGGIGLRVWDPELDNGALTITSVKVVPEDEAAALRDTLPLYNR